MNGHGREAAVHTCMPTTKIDEIKFDAIEIRWHI